MFFFPAATPGPEVAAAALLSGRRNPEAPHCKHAAIRGDSRAPAGDGVACCTLGEERRSARLPHASEARLCSGVQVFTTP